MADAYLVEVTGIASQIAAVLGDSHAAEKYRADQARLRLAFRDKYITRAGLVVGDSQTALALALNFALHDEKNPSAQRAAVARLARLVRYARFRVSTGFAGTPQILHALTRHGHLDLAYAMLLEEGCPSWLYQVSLGATTMWERWDSMLPDGSINPGQMTSFNHYALGSVGEWMHRNIGGITPLRPGWTQFAVVPRPGGDITRAATEFLSPHGLIRCAWSVEDGSPRRFRLRLTVPPNSSASINMPAAATANAGGPEIVGSGEHQFECEYLSPHRWPPEPLYTEFGSRKTD